MAGGPIDFYLIFINLSCRTSSSPFTMGWTYLTRTCTICSMKLPTLAKICLFRFLNTFQGSFYIEWQTFQCHFEGEERDCTEIFIPVITDDGRLYFYFMYLQVMHFLPDSIHTSLDPNHLPESALLLDCPLLCNWGHKKTFFHNPSNSINQHEVSILIIVQLLNIRYAESCFANQQRFGSFSHYQH